MHLIARLLCVLCLALPAAAQTFTSGELDLAEGRALYDAYCNNCHGPDGNLIPDIDILADETFNSLSDDTLMALIIQGIPQSPMRPTGLTAFEARTVVVYLRFASGDRRLPNGDADRGRRLFETSAGCLECHSVGGRGQALGPDLSRIGLERRVRELETSILDPNAEVRVENRFVRATHTTGEQTEGRLLNQDSFSVQLYTRESRLVSLDRSLLVRIEFLGSPMPAFGSRLTDREQTDLLTYLVSLKGQ